MEKVSPPKKEVVGEQLIEDISKIIQISLGVGAATCQICGLTLSEGEFVSAYAFRRCPHAVWLVGQTRCADHRLALEPHASRGVREFHVTGRVGMCSDQAMQRSWPVLVAPALQAVSPADSEATRALSGVTCNDVTECPIARAALHEHPTLQATVDASARHDPDATGGPGR